MPPARRFRALLAAPLLLAAACIDAPIETRPGGPDAAGANGNGEDCELRDDTLQPETFESEVMPGLAQCAGNCHGPGSAFGGFAIHGGVYQSADETERCDFVATLRSFLDFADRQNPSESAMLRAIDGRSATHPETLEPTDPLRQAIESYLQDIEGGGDGGGGDAPGLAAFETDVQPILDTGGGIGCAVSGGCHDNVTGRFSLHSEPAPGSSEMRANYDESVARADPSNPEGSILYQRATTTHSGSNVVTADEAEAIASWIASLDP